MTSANAIQQSVPLLTDDWLWGANEDLLILSLAGHFIIGVLALALSLSQFRYQTLTDRRSVKLLRRLIVKSKSRYIPFYVIQHHIGGYDDDELRKLLVRSGSIRVCDNYQTEYWVRYKALTRKERTDPTAISVTENSFKSRDALLPKIKSEPKKNESDA